MVNSFLRATALLAGLLFALCSAALAHGTNQHNETKPTNAAQAEQMPWGVAGSADATDRTIEVSMLDSMRFEPTVLNVQLGETIRFVVRNDGKVMHEFVLGTQETNDAHAALMVKFPGMEHDAPYMAHVEPGSQAEIVWTFNRSGHFKFACLIAGHYQAGMIGAITVAENQPG